MSNYFRLFCCLVLFISGGHCWALKPSAKYAHVPADYNMVFQEVTISTVDGAHLNGWYFENEHETQRTMLICHNGDGNMGDYLDRVDEFLNLNYNVMIFDYRGYGKSSPFAIEPGVYVYPEFANDVRAMIKYCTANSIYPLMIYGWGPGASLALGVGYTDNRVDFILSDSPFLTAKGLSEQYKKQGQQMELPPFYPKTLEPFNTLDEAPGKKLKGILLLVGEFEPFFGKADMVLLQNKKPKLIQIEVIPGAGFKNGFEVNASVYFEKIKGFLDHFDY